MFWRKSKVDKEIDRLCKDFNANLDRMIEEVKPKDTLKNG